MLVGEAGNDRLEGRDGNDTLTGGAGGDTFVFSNAWGRDVITDFSGNSGDRIRFETGFDDFASVMAATSQVGADAVITLDAGTAITLVNVNSANLTADQFIFV